MASNLEKVKIQRNGDGKIEFDVYVVGEKGAPGIVVVQEWWGVDYEIKKHAINIASKGYRALIPEYVNLFSSLPI
jgi:carboxymethylenebutenolidase